MHTRDSVGLALSALKQNKMRSLLTLLGVIIGISSVITILTLGQSLQTQMSDALSNAGVNDLTLEVNKKPTKDSDDQQQQGPRRFTSSPLPENVQFTPEKIAAMRERLSGILGDVKIGDMSYISGDMSSDEATTTDGNKPHNATLRLVNPDLLRMENIHVGWGRSLEPEDVAGERHVAVVSQALATTLYGPDPANALGKHFDITAWNRSSQFIIVGVIEHKKGGLLDFTSKARTAYAPFSLQPRITGQPLLWSSMQIRPVQGVSKQSFERTMKSFASHLLPDDSEYHVVLADHAEQAQVLTKIITGLSIGLAFIGGISLLVGGIGVMNIMLVTVTERTREIGIRKALGAKNKDIRVQFVIEAMIVCLIGGIIGIIIGGGAGMVGAKLIGKLVFPPLWGIIVSLLFSMGIGLFFGYYPANKAAKMNPIDALRHE